MWDTPGLVVVCFGCLFLCCLLCLLFGGCVLITCLMALGGVGCLFCLLFAAFGFGLLCCVGDVAACILVLLLLVDLAFNSVGDCLYILSICWVFADLWFGWYDGLW